MISISNLSLAFGKKILFDKLNFEIQSGKLTVITGLNGTGKTTLLKVMAGELSVNEAKITSDAKKIFFLSQKVSYPYSITLFDYVLSAFYSNSFKWYSSKAEKEKVKEVLKSLSIFDRKDVLLKNLSSGELQLANLAVALISGADCLLLDEPTSNLDLKNQVMIASILKTLTKKGMTCVMITHDLNLAAEYGDYFAGFSEKGFVQGEKSDFFTEKNLEKIFGLKFKVEFEDEKINFKIIN